MLEALKLKSKWVWSAWGKHPLAKDYIHLGTPTALGKAFAKWIAKGHQRLIAENSQNYPVSAWRFWAKGEGRNDLVCGTIQTSSDSIGRPFPLLLMGSGAMGGWKKQWYLVPSALDETYRRLEQLSSYRGKDIQTFEEALVTLAVPRPAWNKLRKQFTPEIFGSEPPLLSATANSMDEIAIQNGDQRMVWKRLEEERGANLLAQSVQIHHKMMGEGNEIPSAAFMGGNPTAAYVALFQRSLRSTDFIRLWNPNQSPVH